MNQICFDVGKFNKIKSYLNTMHLQEQFGRYSMDIWVGDYIRFDEIITNNFHSHSHYEICLVLDGKGLFRHGDETYHLKQGTLFLADPCITHEISSYETKDLYLVFFSFDISKNTNDLSKKYEDNIIEDFIKSHRLVEYNADILFHYLPLINNQFFNKELSSRLFNEYSVIKALIFEFICILTNRQTRNNILGNSANEKLNVVVKYINDHIASKIMVSELAEKHYMSERNLRRLFKKHYNKSVHQYIEERKMKIASSKLLMGFRVVEAARAIGIEDVSYFSRIFKKHFNISPREYKNKPQ